MRKNKDEKISVKRMIQNTFYIINYAYKKDKKLIIWILSSYILFQIGNALINTLFIKKVIDMLGDKSSLTSVLIMLILGMAASVSIALMDTGTMQWLEVRLVKITGDIQRELIEKSSRIDLKCYDEAEYFDDFVIAASQCEDMMKKGVLSTTYIIGNTLSILTLGGIVMTINPIIAIFPVLGFIVNIVTRFKITKYEYQYDLEKKKYMRKADYSKRVFYQPEYTKEIKLSNVEIPLHKQFDEAIDEVIATGRKYGKKIAVLSLINWITVFTFLSFFCVPMYLGYLALVKMSILLGDVAAMTNAANSIRWHLDSTNYALIEFQNVGQYAERFRKFVNYKVNIEGNEGTEEIPDEGQDIEIKNMSFKYDNASDYTLKNISMKIKNGEKIAIVGENGAGKTTFVKLLMKLYEVTDGEILYGQHNINEYGTKDYRDNIGAVFQDFQIYAGTVGENVLMDTVEDKDREVIQKALEYADFKEKLKKMPKGIDTPLTKEFDDEGTLLSGGESQKIAIARMFAKGKKAKVAILDEPSSALDPVAEYTLNNNMMKNAENSTVIFISHRLSTTRDADKIYLFEHGQICEEGTHEELMRLGGQYKKMFEKQAHYYQLEVS